ncbi:MAG: hypothetical protein J1E61_11165 [Lachnospiraceae bacterium]|nr:hypothetical protein [Lachnospiraceae bacterium]
MDINQLSKSASAIINMFKGVFNTPKGFDIQKALLYASGLAGYACHQAVKANNESFVVVGTVDNKKFYMGDALNKYLLEDKYSVLSFCNGFFDNFAKGEFRPDPIEIVKKEVAVIGDNNYKIWNIYQPKDVYCEIRNCWEGIYDNMTAVYCQSPQEWPVLFAIVLQNIMITASEAIPAPVLYNMALECAIYVSKMDSDSI